MTRDRAVSCLVAFVPVLEVKDSASHMQFQTPGKTTQPNIGGWHTKDGSYFQVPYHVGSLEGQAHGGEELAVHIDGVGVVTLTLTLTSNPNPSLPSSVTRQT